MLGPEGLSREFVRFPDTKEAVEQLVAKLFCSGNSGMNPQIKRYRYFSDLKPQPENSLDCRIDTELGLRWIELAEFTPVSYFGNRYGNVPCRWTVEQCAHFLMELIQKKSNKCYGSGVILVIYKTHETLFVPPPILRSVRGQLTGKPPSFESVYFLSPHDEGSASAWEIWPGDPDDQGPLVSGGTFHVGFGGLEPGIS